MNAPANKTAKTATNKTGTPAPKRDKGAAFVKLANKRTNKALAAINGVAALANPRSYSYTDAHVDRIAGALRDALASLEKRFAASKAGAETGGGFTL